MKIPTLKLALAAIALSGCQHKSDAVPAVLSDTTEQNMQDLKSALAKATGRTAIELGAGDPASESRISVLPPRLTPQEDRSPVRPVLFDLIERNGVCFAVQVDTQVETELTDVRCRPL